MHIHPPHIFCSYFSRSPEMCKMSQERVCMLVYVCRHNKLGFKLELQNLKSEVQKSESMQIELTNKTAELNSSILKQIDEIQHLSGIVEFLPLLKATSGLKVPNHLKAAVVKAIDILKLLLTQPCI
jgi:hypothetical protein